MNKEEAAWIYRNELEKLNEIVEPIKRRDDQNIVHFVKVEGAIYDIKTNMTNTDNVAKSAHVIASENAYAIRRIERVLEELTGKRITKMNE